MNKIKNCQHTFHLDLVTCTGSFGICSFCHNHH